MADMFTSNDLEQFREAMEDALRWAHDVPNVRELPPMQWGDPRPMTVSGRTEAEAKIRADLNLG